jgi:3-oxoacyl-[acyl-carrier-protein] synthase-3
MFNSRIIGTGSYIPDLVLTNHDLERIVDTTDDWIIRRTGIKERHIVKEGQYASDLAAKATEEALEMACISPAQLDLIVVGTVTPDRQFPSCACTLQHKIGALNAASMDVSAGCSGFIYALSIAHNAIRCGEVKYALVVGTEVLSSVTNWADRGTCVLLGDGAGAVILGRTTQKTGIQSIQLKADGSFGNLLYAVDEFTRRPVLNIMSKENGIKPYYLVMDGHRLFKKAVQCLEDIARTTLERAKVTVGELSLVVPHQANIRIINALAGRLGIAIEKVFITIQKYGNTSSSSIPIALNEARKMGLLSPFDKLLMVTFGAGLTWGAALVEWNP